MALVVTAIELLAAVVALLCPSIQAHFKGRAFQSLILRELEVIEIQWQEQLRAVYRDDVELLDLTVGMFAETPPHGFGFSDTAFRIFVLMAARRLNSDRFFTIHYTEGVYSRVGMDYIPDSDTAWVLMRHYSSLAPSLSNGKNAFAPLNRVAG